MKTTQQQQPTTGLEYQIRLLELEAQHYQENKFGAPHLLQAVARVAMYAPALAAAREALEMAAALTFEEWDSAGNEAAAAARAALQQLNGGVQP